MTDRSSPASVRQRLLNLSNESGATFDYVLVRYANERLLFRLSRSRYREQYVLKGASLFAIWMDTPHRPTRDIDLLGFGEMELSRLDQEFREICLHAVEPDGISFDPDSVSVTLIREGQTYEGLHVTLAADLAGARIPVQIDVGFGDSVQPGVKDETVPPMLEFPPPVLKAYRPETVIAEKFEAIVRLGMANTRMKDFHDLYVMANALTFVDDDLARAVHSTFERRRTQLPVETPVGLTEVFVNDAAKQAQWHAFLRRIGVSEEELPLEQVAAALRAFLLPLSASAAAASGGFGTARKAK